MIIHNRRLFLIVQEAEKSTAKVPVDSGKSSPSPSRYTSSCFFSHDTYLPSPSPWHEPISWRAYRKWPCHSQKALPLNIATWEGGSTWGFWNDICYLHCLWAPEGECQAPILLAFVITSNRLNPRFGFVKCKYSMFILVVCLVLQHYNGV